MSRLDDLQLRLTKYVAEESEILEGAQEYSISSRHLIRARLDHVAEMIKYLEREIASETVKQSGSGRNRVVGVIPRDF